MPGMANNGFACQEQTAQGERAGPAGGLRFRLGQGLDRRPQLINQRRAITDLSALFDTGQSVPQCQSRLPLSEAACSSSFEATAISPSAIVTGISRQSVIPSLAMM